MRDIFHGLSLGSAESCSDYRHVHSTAPHSARALTHAHPTMSCNCLVDNLLACVYTQDTATTLHKDQCPISSDIITHGKMIILYHYTKITGVHV